jgi:hypothetical protein
MVESRREIADELSKAAGPVKTTGLLAAFIEVQNAIDQIDKAIADEQKLAPPALVKGFSPDKQP